MQVSYKTIATFCEHTAEMLEGVSDNAELIKRHRASLERLRVAQAAGSGRTVAGFGSATKRITTAVSPSTAP